MKMNATKLLSMLLAVSLMAALAACGATSTQSDTSSANSDNTSSAAAADDSPVYGGKLVSYHSEFYNQFDPSVNTQVNTVSFYCDMLWNIDWSIDRTDFNYGSSYIDSKYLTGQIAKEWTIADDFSSMTVTLRDDVYFQDKTSVGMDSKYDVYQGRQLVASDVKWTYDRLLGLDGVAIVQEDQTSWPTILHMLNSVEVIDDQTVKFSFNTTDELSVNNFMCAFVNIGGPEWDTLTDEQQSDWHYADGTGPFILTDYTGDNTMTFTKNPKYWDTDADGNQLPYLDEVELVYMADSATMLSSFIAGDLQILAANNDLISTDQATQLKASLSADQYEQYTYYGSCIGVGLKQGTNGLAPLADEKVREAMQYAIDVSAISQYAGYEYDGVESMLNGCFAQGTAWNDVDAWGDDLINSYTTYDPDKARQLLEEAGYGDGFSFDVTLFQKMPVEQFQLAAQYLAVVGITMNITIVQSPNEMTAIGMDPDNPGCQFCSFGCDSVSFADNTIPSSGTNNPIKQNNPEIETLFNTFYTSTTVEDQVAAAKTLDQSFMSNHYILYVSYAAQSSNWYRSNVHGLNGERVTQCYYMGYMFARTWVTD